ncbi:MAG TPA: alpha/beta fold hydrolase [Allosphingosinicella sp.]
MWPLTILLTLVLLYASVCAVAWAMQDRMLFPTGMIPPAEPLPPGAERLEIASGGERIQGLHIPAVRPSASAPVVIGFGGNAWNAEEMADYLHLLYPRSEVLAFHYRGYSPSGGRPSAEALVADAPLIYDLAAARMPGRPIVAVGFSIGSGVAASLAPRRPLAGLILVTPFDSLSGVAAGHFRWLPVRRLFRHDLPTADWLRETGVPVALVAAERDTLVTPERTESLRRALPTLAFDRTISGADHNSIYQSPAFRDAMAEAMEAVARAK